MIRGLLLLFILGLAMNLQAAISGFDRGTGGGNSSSSSIVVAPTSTAIAAGSAGVILIAADNVGTTLNFPTSVTDSVGNVWIIRVDAPGTGANGNNFERVIYVCDKLTTQLQSTDNITINLTAAITAKAWALVEAVPANAANFCIVKTYGNTSISAGATTVTLNLATLLNGDMEVGMVAAEGPDGTVTTPDSDTTNGSWSTHQHNGFGSGAAGMSISSQWKVGSGAPPSVGQTYNVTLTAADVGEAYVLLSEAPPNARAVFGNSTSETTSVLTFTKAIASGSQAVMCWAGDNSGSLGGVANLPGPLTDSKGNTWTLQQDGIYDPGAVNTGIEIGIYTSTISSAIAQGDTLNIGPYLNATSVPTKSWAVFEFSDGTAYSSSGVGTGNTSTSPTVTTSSITNGHYVVGVAGSEGEIAWTPDSGTTNGTWSSPCLGMAGLAAGATTIIAQYKKVTATATQTYSPTMPSADWMIGWADVTAPAAPTGNTGAFFQMFP